PFAKGKVKGVSKLRVDPDSKAFDIAVFYSDRDPVLYRDQLGGRYTPTPFNGTMPDAAWISADFNNDGLADVARVSGDGKLHLMLNNTIRSSNRWIRVQLQGVKSLKLAQDAIVEIKAGSLYRKQWYTGVPLVFDAGTAATVDTVRITWSNGL